MWTHTRVFISVEPGSELVEKLSHVRVLQFCEH